MVEAGVSAVVLRYLFEEQIEHPTLDADQPRFFVNPGRAWCSEALPRLIDGCLLPHVIER